MAAEKTSPLYVALTVAVTMLEDARRRLKSHEESARKAAHAEWVNAGGCPLCNGLGGHSTSYHDGDSVWDACSRIALGTCSYRKMAAFAFSPASGDDTVGMTLADEVYALESEVSKLESANEVGKGKLVRVYKGRKVPVGTTGRIIWVGEQTFGKGYFAKTTLRVGVKDDAGEVHWTAADNVEVLEDVPADTRPEAEKPVKGRKVKHGDTIGVVFWYGRGRDGASFRVGYNALEGRRVSKEAVWADASEVEVLAA